MKLSENRIKKEDLILPTLAVIAGAEKIYEDYSLSFKGITTTVLKSAVLGSIEHRLSNEDKEQLSGRKDRKIDQVFRNIFSHKTLENAGFIISDKETGKISLSEKGYEKLFNYFNTVLEIKGIDKVSKEATFKESVFSQIYSGNVRIENQELTALDEKIKNIIKSKSKNKMKY